jgi:hypothetical protein
LPHLHLLDTFPILFLKKDGSKVDATVSAPDFGVHEWVSQLTDRGISVGFERTDFERGWKQNGDAMSSVDGVRKAVSA